MIVIGPGVPQTIDVQKPDLLEIWTYTYLLIGGPINKRSEKNTYLPSYLGNYYFQYWL